MPLLHALATLLVTVAASAAQSSTVGSDCDFSPADTAWVARALDGWRLASREIAGIEGVPPCQAIFFDAKCVRTSADALASTSASGVSWTAAPHAGRIALPRGDELPAGITSFTSGTDGRYWFVMSTPSVWEAGGAGKGESLETTMVTVMIHESSHVAQLGPYGKRLGALIEKSPDPEAANDNAVEDRFKSNAEFAASVQRDTALFHQAAAAKDDSEAKLLAFEAREVMRERAAKWFVGADAYLLEADHVWLTFEGAGQWIGYQWLIHPQGGGKKPADVLRNYYGGNWSQSEGFALVLALDRIVGPAWKKHAYGDGAKSVIEMLDEALEG